MALIKVNTNSSVFNMGVPLYVILPQQDAPAHQGGTSKPGPYKTLYLLHGQGGNFADWVRNTMLERYATEHSLAVVMPSGDNSFYSDLQNGMKYSQYLTGELIATSEAWFPLSTDPKDRFIGGYSMGGYGALRTAMLAPHLYSKVLGVSSLVDILPKYKQEGFEDRARFVFGELDEIDENGSDIFAAAKRMASMDSRPDFCLTIGKDDARLEQNKRLAELMNELGISVRLDIGEGGHDYGFADGAVKKALPWLTGSGREA